MWGAARHWTRAARSGLQSPGKERGWSPDRCVRARAWKGAFAYKSEKAEKCSASHCLATWFPRHVLSGEAAGHTLPAQSLEQGCPQAPGSGHWATRCRPSSQRQSLEAAWSHCKTAGEDREPPSPKHWLNKTWDILRTIQLQNLTSKIKPCRSISSRWKGNDTAIRQKSFNVIIVRVLSMIRE